MQTCLIFDLDGTLVDSLPGIAASLNRALAAHELPQHTDAAIRSFVGDGLLTLVQRAAPADSDTTLITALVSFFKQDYGQTWPTGTLIYPGIAKMLEKLHEAGHPLAVLSNKTHDFTVAMVHSVFPQIHFAMVLGQRDGTAHKPSPVAAFQIAAALGTPAANCIIIGDSSIDMETAANAGMQSIAVTWGYHDRARLLAAGAVRIIDQASELPNLLS